MTATSVPATRYRWSICALLFFATTINYLDRQVLSLTWKDFIVPEFHWTNSDYGTITSLFSIFYAFGMLIAGRFVDWMDTKKGFLWAIFIWSIGACVHALCGIATSGILTGHWLVGFEGAREAVSHVDNIAKISSVSVTLFIFARLVLAIGEAGNFPAAIKTTAEFYPKKDRAFSTSLWNAGATVGALAAPLIIPPLALYWGWEAAFVVIGALGFVWMGFWVLMYDKPEVHPRVNAAELTYIRQDMDHDPVLKAGEARAKTSFLACLRYRQTWAFALGKLLTDGVWWFFLFWTPAYLSAVYHIKSSDPAGKWALFTLYAITLLSIIGGWLPSYFVGKKGMNPYAGRMKAMLIFAFFPLLALLAQPLGTYSYWWPVIIIGIAGAAHQAWSANLFSTVGDMFPRKAIATITGIGGMAGGIGAFAINKSSGVLFDYAKKVDMTVLGFKGEEAGYFIIFSFCAVAYLVAWIVMRTLVPHYKPITDL
ncbi:MAG: MFS transporter [Luteolibacter sp.]|uniref:MFS transporter n=1 Tax=Luteolibacter sp. TaxID=1962973 RepID=UPI0032677F45